MLLRHVANQQKQEHAIWQKRSVKRLWLPGNFRKFIEAGGV